MQTLPDYHLDALFRAALGVEAEALAATASSESQMLERIGRVLVRRRKRRQFATLLLAAVLTTLIAGAIALGGSRPTPPVTPERSQEASATLEPSIAQESAAPSASPIPVAGPGGVWNPTGSMVTPRVYQDAVRLLDGRVLVVGGSGGESDPTTAEVYDPVSGTWSATGNMLNRQIGLPPTLLLDGRVLVGDIHGDNPKIIGSELYDPATGTWSATGDMIGFEGDGGAPAALLPDGKVLVAGLDGAHLYDPDSGTWTATGTMNIARELHMATLLSDGKVLVAGGFVDREMNATDSAEVYDPATGSWTEIANMQAAHRGWMTTLSDGKALVMSLVGSWELYDPATGTWTALPRPSGFNAVSALLSDGTVLMTDPDETNPGPGPAARCPAAVFDPRTGSLTTASSMLLCDDVSSFTLLLDGTVLKAGGRVCNDDGVTPGTTGSTCVSTDTAELYVPAGVPLPEGSRRE